MASQFNGRCGRVLFLILTLLSADQFIASAGESATVEYSKNSHPEEPTPKKSDYPLWNGQESVTDYARRVNLPTSRTLDLGNGVKMELVLIPAGKFQMGTPEYEKPFVGQMIVGASDACFWR